MSFYFCHVRESIKSLQLNYWVWFSDSSAADGINQENIQINVPDVAIR